MTIASKVKMRINRSKRYVFARADFTDIAGYDQVGRELKKLVDTEYLLRIGYGLYTKARKNRITGNLMAASPAGADGVILEAIEKLGIDYTFDEFSQRSIDGDSLQIPASFQIITNNRFKRKIVVNNRAINAN
ncbi:MAG: S-adenosylhomocysteine hydrolase [Alteromonadaceae bacterium]|nr:S-adenosylhomocysteine hydrolase [Alteromonadaceae bacterium]